MDPTLSPAVKYLSKKAKKRISASEALKPLRKIVEGLEERLLVLETSIQGIEFPLDPRRDLFERLSRPRYRRDKAEIKMDSRKPFNHYVRSKHSGLSPFRTNFNMGTQFLLASSRQLTDTQPGTSVGGLPGRSGSTVLSSIQNHPTGAIPKKNVNKNLPRNVNQRKENRHETVDRNRRRLRADAPNVVPEPSLSFRTPSPSVIIITEPDNGPSFHRERLKAETEWLLERADYWTTVKTDVPDLPNWVVETIDIAVGGIRLMVNSKFKQFEKLIEHCASRYKLISRIPIAVSSSSRNSPAVVYSGQSSAASPPVLPEDLDGFWDTMYLQVQSLRNRLEILEKAKANNWNDPRAVPAKEIRPKNSNKVVPFPSKGRSKFREFLKNKQISSGLPGPVQEEPAKEVPLEALPNGPNEARCLTPRRHQDLIRSSFGFVSDTPRNGPATPMPSTPWRSFSECETDEVFTDVKFSPLATSVMPEEGAFGGPDRRESAQVPAPKVLTPFAARNLKKAENFSRRTSVGVVMRLSLLGRLSRDETVLHTFENPDSE